MTAGDRGSYGFVTRLRSRHQVFFALLVAIGIVSVWRGLWGIMDVVLLPENYLLSSVVSLLIGVAILAGMHMFVSEFIYD